MGTFRTDCVIENILRREKSATISQALVDAGSEFTWVTGDVQHITRSVGFAIVRVGKEFTVDEVVFAKPGDMSLLGARSLEGLSLRVDPRKKKLVGAGPYTAAPAM